jgi:hypothetical protein
MTQHMLTATAIAICARAMTHHAIAQSATKRGKKLRGSSHGPRSIAPRQPGGASPGRAPSLTSGHRRQSIRLGYTYVRRKEIVDEACLPTSACPNEMRHIR